MDKIIARFGKLCLSAALDNYAAEDYFDRESLSCRRHNLAPRRKKKLQIQQE